MMIVKIYCTVITLLMIATDLTQRHPKQYDMIVTKVDHAVQNVDSQNIPHINPLTAGMDCIFLEKYTKTFLSLYIGLLLYAPT